MTDNKLLKHQQEQDKEDAASPDLLPDLEVLEHVDISFLMNYSLDSDLSGIQQKKDLNSQDSWIGSSPVSIGDSTIEHDPEFSLNLKDVLEDEFLGLISKDDKEQKTQQSTGRFSIDPSQLFDTVKDGTELQVDESSSGILDLSGENSEQDYQTILPDKKFINFVSQDKIQIGLDIGEQTIKYVVIGKFRKKNTLLAFGILANSLKKNHNELDIANYFLENLKLKSSFPKARVSWNIYGPKVGIKRISLPQMKKQMLAEAVAWSVKKDMNLENEKAVIDFIELSRNAKEDDKQHQLLVVGCSEEFVYPRASAFLNKKVTPFKVTPLPVSLWKLYQNSSDYNDQNCVAIINMGAKTTIIAFINQGNLDFFREIPTGGRDITEALMGTIFYHGKPYQLDDQKAEELKLKFGFPDNDLDDVIEDNVPVKEFAVLFRPILERLGNEIRRSIDYYKEHFSKSSINKIYFLGGSAKLKNFTTFIKEFVEEDIGTIGPPLDIECKLSESDRNVFQDRFLELAAPYSLAIDNDSSLNLLPAFVKKLQKLASFKKISIYTVGFGLLFLGLFSGYSHLNSRQYQSEYQMLQTQYTRLEPLKRQFDVLKLEQGNLLNKRNIYNKELILENPLPIIMQAVSNLLPRGTALRSMTLQQFDDANNVAKPKKNKAGRGSKKNQTVNPESQEKSILLSGVALNPGPEAGITIANYMLSLSKTGLFKSVKLNNQNYNEEDDELLFNIEAVIK